MSRIRSTLLRTPMRKAALLFSAILMTAAIAGCSAKTSSFSIVSGLDNTVSIQSENSDTDTTGEGNIRVDEGMQLIVSAEMTSGAIHLSFTVDGGSEPAIEADFDTTGSTAYGPMDPGEYKIACSILKNDTTGKIRIVTEAAPEEEAEKADAGQEAAAPEETEGKEELPSSEEAAPEESVAEEAPEETTAAEAAAPEETQAAEENANAEEAPAEAAEDPETEALLIEGGTAIDDSLEEIW